MAKNIIEIKNLKKYFKEVKAVDDITFSVREGEFLAFLGLNGAGKSTTINIICNTLAKDSGEVYVDGLSVDKSIKEIKPKLGVVFQNNILDERLSVIENLQIRAGLYGISGEKFKARLKTLAEGLEFSDLLKRSYGKLSGGQKRRIDIARALIHDPKIIILDEPTTGLDPQTRMLVWNLLNKLRKENNLSILLTTHYMEEAADADYVVIMDSGKIVASDTPNNLKNQYAYDFIRIYNYDSKLLSILDKNDLKYTQTKSCIEIVVKNTEKAKEFILKNNKLFNDFEVIKGKMDNVFLNVTGKHLKEF